MTVNDAIKSLTQWTRDLLYHLQHNWGDLTVGQAFLIISAAVFLFCIINKYIFDLSFSRYRLLRVVSYILLYSQAAAFFLLIMSALDKFLFFVGFFLFPP
jgi:hypothetical protein